MSPPASAEAARGAEAADTAGHPAEIAADDGAPDSWMVGTLSRPSTIQVAVPVLAALRTGRHDEFERLVLELGGEGSGLPASDVFYIDRPLHECGSGREIFPFGDAWLEIRLEPLDAHAREGQPTASHRPQDPPGLDNFLRLYMTCDFEAVITVVLAVRSPNRFRVFSLDDPRRIVVDVRKIGRTQLLGSSSTLTEPLARR